MTSHLIVGSNFVTTPVRVSVTIPVTYENLRVRETPKLNCFVAISCTPQSRVNKDVFVIFGGLYFDTFDCCRAEALTRS